MPTDHHFSWEAKYCDVGTIARIAAATPNIALQLVAISGDAVKTRHERRTTMTALVFNQHRRFGVLRKFEIVRALPILATAKGNDDADLVVGSDQANAATLIATTARTAMTRTGQSRGSQFIEVGIGGFGPRDVSFDA